jgi:glycogen operon protein
MWFNPGGNEMSEEEWTSPFVRCLGMLLSGDTIDVLSFEGQPVRDETFLLLLNAHYEPIDFVLPGLEKLEWELILDTKKEEGFLKKTKALASGDDFDVADRSTCLFRLAGGAQAQARQESWKKRHFGLPAAFTAEEERAARKPASPRKNK